MFSGSRKAQHDSFAHHRASLLFSGHLEATDARKQWLAGFTVGQAPLSTGETLAERVRAGIRGFVPAGPQAVS